MLPQELLELNPKNLTEFWENLLPDKCEGCSYKDLRLQIVGNRGDGTCGLCFCGEGPGAQEDDDGVPFCGPVGKYHDKLLQAAGINPARCWFTNAVKCRPFPRGKPIEQPTLESLTACRPLLIKEMSLLNPPILIALGKWAYKTLAEDPNPNPPLADKVGRFFHSPSLDRKFVVMYHPSYLHRQGGDAMTTRDAKSAIATFKRLSLMAGLVIHEWRKTDDSGNEGG